MREIKFRAWLEDEKRYITDSQDFIPIIVTNKGLLRLSATHEENLYSLINDGFILEQFTGLKDKYGKEIFEGDVILFGDEKHVVEWSEFDSSFVTRYGDSYRFDKRYTKEWEVIGNIHEPKQDEMKGDNQ